jgi:Neprosin
MKDPATNLWTLYRDDLAKRYKLGWWQSEIFDDLDNATSIQWAGYVQYNDHEAGPAMGSGHFAREGRDRAAYMAGLQFFDKAGNSYDSPQIFDLVKDVDRPDCYTATPAMNFNDEADDKHKFYYGGPAGCRN